MHGPELFRRRVEPTRLAKGMCFSNEPGLYVPDPTEFVSTIVYMTAGPPRYVTKSPTSIDNPMV
jgi:Xaa-Pro dipeptidase